MNVYYCQACGYRTTNESGLKRSRACCGSSGLLCPRCPNVVMRIVASTGNAAAQPGQGSSGNQPGQGRFQKTVAIRKGNR